MTCKDCVHVEMCHLERCYQDDRFEHKYEIETHCEEFKNKADFVEVVRCKDCIHATEFDQHCELNRFAYRHCELWKGDETRNVWHKYKKYYRDYSIVEGDEFCSSGVRREK